MFIKLTLFRKFQPFDIVGLDHNSCIAIVGYCVPPIMMINFIKAPLSDIGRSTESVANKDSNANGANRCHWNESNRMRDIGLVVVPVIYTDHFWRISLGGSYPFQIWSTDEGIEASPLQSQTGRYSFYHCPHSLFQHFTYYSLIESSQREAVTLPTSVHHFESVWIFLVRKRLQRGTDLRRYDDD